MPDSAKERPQKGEVLAVGPGLLLESGLRVKPAIVAGDVVYYGKYSPNRIELDGEEYLIVKESDILGKVIPD